MTSCPRVDCALATVLLCALLFAVPAQADVNLCLNCCGNSSLIYNCYETELTCDEISLGPIIRACEQLSIAPPPGGGGTGSGVTGNVHPEVNGQSLLGPATYGGEAPSPVGTLGNFIVIRETRDTNLPGRRCQAVGSAPGGELYWAEFDVAGLDRGSAGDLLFRGTAGGQEIYGAFGTAPVGRTAGGDMTVTVTVLAANDPPVAKETVLEEYHTDIVFADLTWTYLAPGPVTVEYEGWGAVKAFYR